MRYENICKAKFVKRPNRFIAEVELDGKTEIVHVKNTGRCKELLIPGCEVWLTAPDSPGRKTKYDLVAVRKDNGILFNIDSQAPNKVVKEWLLRQQNYDLVIPEYKYGNSRIDFYMEKNHRAFDKGNVDSTSIIDKDENLGKDVYLMEIKGCTLERDGIGYFPDAPTERGIKHIEELIKAKKEGYNAVLGFVIQVDGINEVRPNIETHPEFGDAMKKAKERGVEIVFYTCHVEPDLLTITDRITAT